MIGFRRGHREGRGPPNFQGPDAQHRSRRPHFRHRPHHGGGWGHRGPNRALPADHPTAYTLGGTGGGIAYNRDEFEEIAKRGMDLSPVCEILVEESLVGWKEYEMEVMRDRADNCVIICSIENFDPMGVHTGDSITVAPIQTLTDKDTRSCATRASR